jgi:hypothetical protein
MVKGRVPTGKIKGKLHPYEMAAPGINESPPSGLQVNIGYIDHQLFLNSR